MASFNTIPSWLDKWHARQMKDPEFRVAIEELEPWYQATRQIKNLELCIDMLEKRLKKLENGHRAVRRLRHNRVPSRPTPNVIPVGKKR